MYTEDELIQRLRLLQTSVRTLRQPTEKRAKSFMCYEP